MSTTTQEVASEVMTTQQMTITSGTSQTTVTVYIAMLVEECVL